MMELRRVLPNNVTKPISEPRLRLAPVASTVATPPTSANGKLARV